MNGGVSSTLLDMKALLPLTHLTTMKMQKRVLEIAALGSQYCCLLGLASSGVKNPSATGVTELRGDEKVRRGNGRGVAGPCARERQDRARHSERARRLPALPTPPVVVLDPVLNETRFPINKNIFLDRIRSQLLSKSAGQSHLPRP